jgi:superfamily I DNA/RNA helicase
MCQLDEGALVLPYTRHLIERFREIRAELDVLRGHATVVDTVNHWLPAELEGIDSFRTLVHEILPEANTPAEVLRLLLEAVSQPDVPPDVTETRIMSLHKSKCLSSPVVIIGGCIQGLLPSEPDTDEEPTPAERIAHLEEQRRLFYVGLTRVKADLERGWPGTLFLTSSRAMTIKDVKQSKIPDDKFSYKFGRARVQMSQFIRELGPAAPAPRAG